MNKNKDNTEKKEENINEILKDLIKNMENFTGEDEI